MPTFPNHLQDPWSRRVENDINVNEQTITQLGSTNNRAQATSTSVLSSLIDTTNTLRNAASNGDAWYSYSGDAAIINSDDVYFGTVTANVEKTIYSTKFVRGSAGDSAMFVATSEFIIYSDNPAAKMVPMVRVDGVSIFGEVGERNYPMEVFPESGQGQMLFALQFMWYEDTFAPDTEFTLAFSVISDTTCNLVRHYDPPSNWPNGIILRYAAHISGSELT